MTCLPLSSFPASTSSPESQFLPPVLGSNNSSPVGSNPAGIRPTDRDSGPVG